MGRYFGYPKFRVTDANGDPLAGGKVSTYFTGTTTYADTYSDAAKSALNTNPIILDAAGECWLFPDDVVYTIKITDKDDVLLWSEDGIGEDGLTGQITAFAARLADTTNVAEGDALIGFKQPLSNSVGATVHSKLLQYVSAFDFLTAAEIADITTLAATIDVTTKLNYALASGASIVFFPAGKYRVSGAGVFVPSNVTLQGAGRTATWFSVDDGSTAGVSVAATAYATVSGVKISYGSGSPGVGILATGNATYSNIYDIEITGVPIVGIDIVNNNTRTVIRNCTVTGTTAGIRAAGSTKNVHVSDSKVSGGITTAGTGFYIVNCLLGGNPAIGGTATGVVACGCTFTGTATTSSTSITMVGTTLDSSPAPTRKATSSYLYGGVLALGKVSYLNDSSTAVADDSSGLGSPEGVVTAGIGSTYRRLDGGAGTCFYVKESGAGNTGWVGK